MTKIQSKPSKKRTLPIKKKKTREIEGAALATIDTFMDMIGTKQDAPLLLASPQSKTDASATPIAVKALDFFGIVFANETKVPTGDQIDL